LTQDREVILITVILSFSFLPQFFFILFAYGLTPGFFFMILGFYNAIRFSRLHKVHNAVFAVIGAAVAATFKQNFLIGVIAIVIFWLLDAMRLRGKDILKPVVASLALILCFSVPSFLVRMYFEEKSDVKLGEGTPTVLWLAMGTDIDNRYLGPGWYTGFNYATYTNSGYDTEEAARIGNERLKENLEEIKENPKEALTFFKDKTISQWCEPMFQSAWSGPLESCNQFTHTKLLQSIYNGEAAAERLAMFSKLVVLLIFGCTVLFLLSKKRDGFGWQVLLLFFIGGLLFQTVWEGKSQYIYPYVFSLIPTAAYGLKLVSDKTKTWIDVRSRKRIMENNE